MSAQVDSNEGVGHVATLEADRTGPATTEGSSLQSRLRITPQRVLLVLIAGLVFTRRRSYFILWTGWLVAMVGVFSDVFTFHSCYTAGLSPPIAAILGVGIASLWTSRTEVRLGPPAPPEVWFRPPSFHPVHCVRR